ncbi:MAG: leucine-rich repeat protein [Oscillospiraceae bacterium]|nr:leucine-rich repeat protein [Oscillospiraceae bacterium]
MKKQVLSIALAALMLGSGAFVPAETGMTADAADIATEGRCSDTLTWTFNVNSGTLRISGQGAMADFTKDFSTYSSTASWDDLYMKVKKIVIDDGVTSIGDYAFNKFGLLKTVEMPDSVTSIGEYAFSGCKVLPEITFSKNLKTIGAYAFDSCAKLTSVTLPDGLTSIDRYAFSYCTELLEIAIPQSVKYFGLDAFKKTKWLTAQQRENPLLILNGVVVDGAKAGETVVLPDTVTAIAPGAFRENKSLANLTIPASVKEFGEYAFANTPWLEEKREQNPVVIINNVLVDGLYAEDQVAIPDGVVEISPYAFAECNLLSAVQIPDSVKTIGNNAFSKCTKLTDVTIPDSVTTLGNSIFYECSALETTTLPAGMTKIPNKLFYNCKALTEITIPGTVTVIGDYAFYRCNALVTADLPAGVKHIGTDSFYDCEKLASVELPAGLEYIGKGAFADCSKIPAVTVPGSVKIVHAGAFSQCTKMKTVVLSEGVEILEETAFGYCYAVDSFTFPSTIKEIGDWALAEARSLRAITGYEGTVAEEKAALMEKKFISLGKAGEPAAVKGDMNGDGAVNLKDVTILRRYIAGGWTVVLDETAADINGDGKVNLKDVTLLRRYIAGGWDVEL